MRRLLILICFVVCLVNKVWAASFAQIQHECSQRTVDNPPQIMVEYRFGKLNIDTSKTADELTTLAREFNPKAKNTDNIQGLTGLKFASKMNIETLTEQIGENNVCVVPKKVHLQVYYEKPTIYLINKLKPKTCRYNLVLRHEYTHLDIGHTALKELALRLKQKLFSAVEQHGAKVMSKSLYMQDNQAVVQRFLQDYENSIKPLMNSYKEKLLEEQAQLDTPENYKRETALCP